MSTTITGPMIYAMSQGTQCEGHRRCHWCGAPCMELWLHDDVAPIPFVKTHGLAAVPSSPWICVGCNLWRRPKITVQFLNGSWKDGQTPRNWSWWITEKEAKAIRPEDHQALWDRILTPPKRFILAMTSTGNNLIQKSYPNDLSLVQADSVLHFTYDLTPFRFTVQDTEETILNGPNGREPGSQMLLRLLGKPNYVEKLNLKIEDSPPKEPAKRGRPVKQADPPYTVKRIIQASGY